MPELLDNLNEMMDKIDLMLSNVRHLLKPNKQQNDNIVDVIKSNPTNEFDIQTTINEIKEKCDELIYYGAYHVIDDNKNIDYDQNIKLVKSIAGQFIEALFNLPNSVVLDNNSRKTVADILINDKFKLDIKATTKSLTISRDDKFITTNNKLTKSAIERIYEDPDSIVVVIHYIQKGTSIIIDDYRILYNLYEDNELIKNVYKKGYLMFRK